MSVCFIGIGSNSGDRKKNIRAALRKIKELKDTKLIKVSKIIETEPVQTSSKQGKFLNAALKIKTTLSPANLLRELQKIEVQLGRPKRHIYHGPRTIDLDILFYGDCVINTKSLKVPHPGVFERRFVFEPLMEII